MFIFIPFIKKYFTIKKKNMTELLEQKKFWNEMHYKMDRMEFKPEAFTEAAQHTCRLVQTHVKTTFLLRFDSFGLNKRHKS